jgi:hypothetical protein
VGVSTSFVRSISPALGRLVERLVPGCTLLQVTAFKTDEGSDDAATGKAAGYGRPLKVRIREASGLERTLVFHTAGPDVFGHDRRSDRAAEMLLGYDTFGRIPGHVQAVDVGAITADGRELVSLGTTAEFYLVTSFAEGHVYADELRRIATSGRLEPNDEPRAAQLARYLVELHADKRTQPALYWRSIRDIVGSGEGIFGMVDAFPEDVPGATRERLQSIEQRAVIWRGKLRERTNRLARTHGDFHPFNVVFDGVGQLHLLDASRGCVGDPADDVTCMAINYVFFAIERPETWSGAFARLWWRFWDEYLSASGDRELLEVVAIFLAWRGLVVTSPVWYPGVSADARDRMLGLIERTLDAKRFDPAFAEALFQ